jgi:cytochrome c oxidase cbb3-type subunit 3
LAGIPASGWLSYAGGNGCRPFTGRQAAALDGSLAFRHIAGAMKSTLRLLCGLLMAGACLVLGQGRGAQSPASTRPPQTVTPQTYPAEQVRAGQVRFVAQCALCHGRDAAGSDTGPDLTRSMLVAEDLRGSKIGPLVRTGRLEKGMPAFAVDDAELVALVAFIHDQKTKAEALGGGRRSVEVADLLTGNAEAGQKYFNGAGNCSKCHSATGDLAGIANRLQGLPLLQRMLYPGGRGSAAKVSVSPTSGETINGTLVSRDEFSIVMNDSSGARRTFPVNGTKFTIDNPLETHFQQLGKYTDTDMHNVYAYLATLR